MELKGDLSPDDGEEGKAQRVGQEKGPCAYLDPARDQVRRDHRHGSHIKVHGLQDPKDGKAPQKEVAQRSAPQSAGKRNHGGAKQVHLPTAGLERSRDGADRYGRQFKEEQHAIQARPKGGRRQF